MITTCFCRSVRVILLIIITADIYMQKSRQMGHIISDDVQPNEVDMPNKESFHQNTQEIASVHRVRLPPRQNLVKEITSSVKETFFADDPLRPFKDKSRSRKCILGLQTIFPILEWGRHYNLQKLRGDFISGLTIASLCIPQVNKKYLKIYYCSFDILQVNIS